MAGSGISPTLAAGNIFAACWMRCTGWRRTSATLVIPARMRTLDGLPPLVDVLPVGGRFGGDLGKVLFEQRGFPRALARLQADLAHVPYWAPPLRSPIPVVCSVLDVIPLALPEYRAGCSTACIPAL